MLANFRALQEESVEVEAIIRMSHVTRWHMIGTTRPQSLAEHTSNVALLTYLIALRHEEYFDAWKIAAAALVHDMGESFSGDVPTPTKRHGIIGEEVSKLEAELIPKVFKQPELNACEKLLIKLCDLADGVKYIRVYGVGAPARHAETGLMLQFERKMDEARNLMNPRTCVEIEDTLKRYILEY